MAKRSVPKRAGGKGASKELREMVMMALLAGVAYGAQQLLDKHGKSSNFSKLLSRGTDE